MARIVLGALWLIGALLLTSAHLRVIAAPPPRRWRYLVAWVVCSIIGGGLLSVLDNMVGRVDWARRFADTAIAGLVAALALAAGAWLTQRPEWSRRHGVVRFLTLVLLHALVVGIVSYPFI